MAFHAVALTSIRLARVLAREGDAEYGEWCLMAKGVQFRIKEDRDAGINLNSLTVGLLAGKYWDIVLYVDKNDLVIAPRKWDKDEDRPTELPNQVAIRESPRGAD